MQNSGITTTLTKLDNELTRLASHVCDPHLRLYSSDLPMLNAIRERLDLISNYTDTLRNSISLINNLPPELLVSILYTAVHTISRKPSTFERKPSHAAHAQMLINFTHVCHHWRMLCLANPTLWTKIIYQPEQDNILISLFIRRSHSAPLDVDLTIRDSPSKTWRTSQITLHDVTAEAQVARFKRLRLSARSPAQLQALEGLQSPAPVLEELTLDVLPSISQPFHDDNLLTLFSGVMPCLRRLTLSQLASMSGEQCRNLTKLVLTQQVYSDSNLSSLISLLEASPTLESLTFDRVSLIKDPSLAVRIALPYLKELSCNCRLSDAGIILRLLELPPDVSTTFQIDMDDSISIGGSMSLTTDSFPSALTQIARATRISIEKYHPQSLITGKGPTFSFSFDLRGSFAMSERQYMVASVCNTLHLEGIEEAHILGSGIARVAAFFRSNLSQLTSLSKLILDCDETSPALELLQHLHPSTETSTDTCLCPRLVDLSLIAFQISHWPILEKLVRTRKQAGFPIKRITVYPHVNSLTSSSIRESWSPMAVSLRDQVESLVVQRLINDPKL